MYQDDFEQIPAKVKKLVLAFAITDTLTILGIALYLAID